jgi:hypothetical protein
MNLIGLIYSTIVVTLGCLIGIWVGNKFGWFGFIIGFLLGAAFGMGCMYVLFRVLSYFYTNVLHGEPICPTCRNGKCQSGDYELRKVEDSKTQFRFDWFCRCGGRYARCGKHFYEVLPDGSFQPYMKWKAFRGWLPEKS